MFICYNCNLKNTMGTIIWPLGFDMTHRLVGWGLSDRPYSPVRIKVESCMLCDHFVPNCLTTRIPSRSSKGGHPRPAGVLVGVSVSICGGALSVFFSSTSRAGKTDKIKQNRIKLNIKYGLSKIILLFLDSNRVSVIGLRTANTFLGGHNILAFRDNHFISSVLTAGKVLPPLWRFTKRTKTMGRTTDFFDIVAGVLLGYTFKLFLLIIRLDYVFWISVDLTKENGIKQKKTRSRRYPLETIRDGDYADDLALCLLHWLRQAARGIGLYVNSVKTELIYFAYSTISSLNDKPLKLVD